MRSRRCCRVAATRAIHDCGGGPGRQRADRRSRHEDAASGRRSCVGATRPSTLDDGGSGQGGHLIFAVAGTLRAVRFDPVRLDVRGDPVTVERVMMKPSGAASYAVSRLGTLVYVPDGAVEPTPKARSSGLTGRAARNRSTRRRGPTVRRACRPTVRAWRSGSSIGGTPRSGSGISRGRHSGG